MIGDRCVVYGTGGASLGTIREALGDQLPLRVLGFIDDDVRQQGVQFSGYSVLGDLDALLGMIQRKEVDCIVLNTHIIDVDRLVRIENACRDGAVDLLRLQVNVKPIVAAS